MMKKYRRLSPALFLMTFAFLIAQQTGWSQKTWLGLSDHWFTAGNWNPAGVPGPMDDVVIPITANDPLIDGMASINRVTIQVNASLTVSSIGQLETNGSSNAIGSITNSGTFINEGQIFLDNNNDQNGFGIRNMSTGNFLNYGQIEIGITNAFSNSGLANLGIFTNELEGSIVVVGVGINGITNGSSTSTNNAVFYNKGHISIPPDSNIPNYGLTNAAQFINENTGVIEIDNLRKLSNGGNFINRNKIFLFRSNSLRGFQNNSSGNVNTDLAEFINEACSYLYVEGELYNTDLITNDGFILGDKFPISGITISTFINNGAFSVSRDLNITNNEILIEPSFGNCSAITNAFDLGATLNFNILGIFTDEDATLSAGTYAVNTNTFTPSVGAGTYTFFVKIEDPENNCEVILPWKVTIESAPIALCQNTSVQLDENGMASISETDIDNGSTDDCGIDSYQVSPSTFDCNNIGENTVTLTVTNVYGNFHTCTSTVAVEGSMPTASCQNTTVQLDENGMASISETDIDNGSTDDCGIDSYQVSPSTFDCNDIGENTVTLTVIATSGATATCSSTVTVEGLPCGYTDSGGIGCGGGNTSTFSNGSFTLSTGSCAPAYPYTGDQIAFVGVDLCGDGELIAQVSDVEGTGFAGIMFRDSEDPGAPMIAIGTNGINRVLKQSRVLPGYPAFPQLVLSYDQFWLRLVRTGNQFQAFASSDGVQWFPYLNQQVMMGECIRAGLFVYSEKTGTPITATFENVAFSGNDPLIGMLPQNNTAQEAAGTSASFIVYPTIVTDQLTITNPNASINGTDKIQVFTTSGQLIGQYLWEQEQATQQINLSALSRGTYYIQLISKTGNQVTSFIKL